MLINDITQSIHKIKYECIDAEVIRNTALHTRGGSRPSGMDIDGWRKILTTNISMALANVAEKLSVESNQTKSTEAFLSSRPIPLDKNPGFQPIGVGKVIRKIIGTAVVHSMKEDIIKSFGNPQVCCGHK